MLLAIQDFSLFTLGYFALSSNVGYLLLTLLVQIGSKHKFWSSPELFLLTYLKDF